MPDKGKAAYIKGAGPLHIAIFNFAHNMAALREFATVVDLFLDRRKRQIVRQHLVDAITGVLLANPVLETPLLSDDQVVQWRKLAGRDFRIDVDDQGSITTDLPPEVQRQTLSGVMTIANTYIHGRLLYRSALIALVSSAEWLVSQIIRLHFELHNDALETKDKTLSLDELKTFRTLEEAVQHVISQRVDGIMRGNLEDWLRFLQQQLKLSAGYLTPCRDQLVEVFQRRNVMIHNNGLVDPLYIAKVAPVLRQNISLGQELPITSEYLQDGIDLAERIFILLAAEFWKQQHPQDSDRGAMLTYISFERLEQERWRVAEGLSFFLKNDKQLPEVFQLSGLLNYWQSLKWQGRFSEVADEIKRADFSAKEEIYQLARYALLDDVTAFVALLPKVARAGKLNRLQLARWPIFREMRKTEEFATFMRVHGEELNLTEAESDSPRKSDAPVEQTN